MSSVSSREELEARVVQLCREGRSRRGISRALGISRNTVRKILDAHQQAREQPHTALPEESSRAPRTKKIDTFVPKIDELLGEFPDITAQRTFEEIQGHGYDGGYTAVKDYLRLVRPKQRPKPSFSLPDYGPGVMAENDWSPYVVAFTNGQKMKVQAFAYTLSHSRRKSFFFYPQGDIHALMDGHVRSFERFGGVAAQCKYDGQKAVVLRWEGPQPIYNPRFVAFATYYEFRPVACKPYSPNEKAHVERAFWEVERSFFNGRKFADFDDLRAQLARWQDTVCDRRRHKKLKRSALEMFVEEQPHLLPLPRHPYDTARVTYGVCSIDGFISWNGNRYAVPYDHVTDILPARITQSEIVIYAADLRPIARHELAPKSAGVEVGADRLHARRGHRSAADAEQVEAVFADLGEGAKEFFSDLQARLPRLAAYHGRQILQLRQRYATSDICRALRHAREYGAFEHKAVERILGVKAAPRTLGQYVAEETARRLRDEVGAKEVPPRDLTEYDQLPAHEEPSQSEDE